MAKRIGRFVLKMGLTRRQLNTLSIYAFFAIACTFFPYFRLVPTGSDLQPHFIVANALLLLMAGYLLRWRIEVSVRLAYCWIMLLYCLVLFTAHQHFDFRGLSAYVTLVIVALSSYTMWRYRLIRPVWIKWFVWAWFVVGAVQATLYRDFMTQILSRATTTEHRGVVGLAPEPSFYATICFFIFLYMRMAGAAGQYDRRTVRLYGWLLVVQIALFAQSPIGFVMLYMYFAIRAVLTLDWRAIAFLAGAPTILFIVGYYLFADSRIGHLIGLVVDEPSLLFLAEGSINDRVAHIFFSIYGFLGSFPLPFGHGTGQWRQFLESNVPQFPVFFWVTEADRVMSGYGSLMFELGLVGVLMPAMVLWSFLRHREIELKIVGLTITATMFSAIPMAFPMFSLLFGMSEAMRVGTTSGRRHTVGSDPHIVPPPTLKAP
jgi:hypothetical protein